jgi:glycosyltransferase involved in cell wall biosynthesis
MPRCSVVIPAYNAESHVAATIESVLNQTYRDFEIVVVDDGSTDRTSEILESFGSKIVHVTQPNRGVSAARNTAFQHASGELLALIDADDLWFPRRLERMVGYLDDNPRVGFATSDAYLRHEETPSTKTYYRDLLRCTEMPENQVYAIAQQNFVFTMVVIRQRLLQQHGSFDESLAVAEDWDLWIRFILGGETLGLLDEALGYYRVRKAGLTASATRAWQRDLSAVRLKAMAQKMVYTTPGSARDLLLPAAREALKRGRDKDAAWLFRLAAQDPSVSAKERARILASAMSARVARTLWRDLVLTVRPDGSFEDAKGTVYKLKSNVTDGFIETVERDDDEVRFIGWATDAEHRAPVEHVALFAGARFLGASRAEYVRPDVARLFGNQDLLGCGFRVVIPRGSFSDGDEARLVAITANRGAEELKVLDSQ